MPRIPLPQHIRQWAKRRYVVIGTSRLSWLFETTPTYVPEVGDALTLTPDGRVTEAATGDEALGACAEVLPEGITEEQALEMHRAWVEGQQ
jgi:hypothetical protein